MTYFEKLPRVKYTEPLYSFKPVASMPPNTLTNADGTPYQAGYDDKSLGQIAYETFLNSDATKRMTHMRLGYDMPAGPRWDLLIPLEQRAWQEVAEAVIKESHEIRT